MLKGIYLWKWFPPANAHVQTVLSLSTRSRWAFVIQSNCLPMGSCAFLWPSPVYVSDERMCIIGCCFPFSFESFLPFGWKWRNTKNMWKLYVLTVEMQWVFMLVCRSYGVHIVPAQHARIDHNISFAHEASMRMCMRKIGYVNYENRKNNMFEKTSLFAPYCQKDIFGVLCQGRIYDMVVFLHTRIHTCMRAYIHPLCGRVWVHLVGYVGERLPSLKRPRVYTPIRALLLSAVRASCSSSGSA